MTAKKGRTAKKATGKEERKKKRPECPLRLRALIDTFVKGLQDYPLRVGSGLAGLRGMAERVRAETQSVVEDMLSRHTEAIQRRLAWELGKAEGYDDYTPEMIRDAKKRILDAFQCGFIESNMGGAKQICKRFVAQATAKQMGEILAAAWDHRGTDFYFDMRETNTEENHRYLRREIRHYRSLLSFLLTSSHLPSQYQATVETAKILGILDALRSENEKCDKRWKKEEGFSRPHVLKKNRGEGLRQQLFWTDVVKRLVGVVNPLLAEKKGERWCVLPEAKERAYGFVSALLNACYPGVEFTPARVKKRFLQSEYDYS